MSIILQTSRWTERQTDRQTIIHSKCMHYHEGYTNTTIVHAYHHTFSKSHSSHTPCVFKKIKMRTVTHT